jgi:hypothetical protein
LFEFALHQICDPKTVVGEMILCVKGNALFEILDGFISITVVEVEKS